MSSAPDAVPARLVAALADKYRIERELGAGGSATVYLAEDLKHHRHVAIKVLKPQVAAALGPERFEDEVRIAANLHHPHILAVHDSGEADGFLYYVMPYVDGRSLRDRLDEGLLPFPKVAKILAEVADALAYAHAAGIVHRDIKPENILHNGKHIVVTDFGIAKAISDAAERKSSTSMGIALGTPAYMAPEQAASDPSLDHRADLYSLGIVGYELLVGHPPFSGTAQQILSSHLTAKPEPIQALRGAVPPALANVVMRALAKAPGDRWPSAEAMQAQLEPLAGTTSNSGMVATVMVAAGRRGPARTLLFAAIGVAVIALGAFAWQRMHAPEAANTAVAASAAATPAAAAPAPLDPNAIPDLATDPSIAVLPFENLSSDKEQLFFSDGIAEELLNLLAKVPNLRVIARTSSFQFRDQDIGIQEIARKLHVAAVLEGSVRKSGDTVRITTQLIRASDGSQLWSDTYDRKLDDVFKVQDEIASTVVGKLKLTLLGAAPTVRLVDPRVYPLILQADALNGQGTVAARAQAIKIYERALVRSPREARAWTGLARAYLNRMTLQGKYTAEGKRQVRDAANKALALDPQLAVAHTYLGRLAMDDNDLVGAAAEYERALAIAPTSLAVLANTATLLQRLGRVDEVNRVRRWSARVDPANPSAHANLCVSEGVLGNLQAAVEACRDALAMSPDYAYLHSSLSQLLLRMGQKQAALEEAALESDESARLVVQAEALHALGRKAESDTALATMAAKYADVYPAGLAEAYAYRGEPDLAFRWLEHAYAVHDPETPASNVLPLMAPLHKDPRWLPFLRKVGIAPEQLAKVKFEVKLPG